MSIGMWYPQHYCFKQIVRSASFLALRGGERSKTLAKSRQDKRRRKHKCPHQQGGGGQGFTKGRTSAPPAGWWGAGLTRGMKERGTEAVKETLPGDGAGAS